MYFSNSLATILLAATGVVAVPARLQERQFPTRQVMLNFYAGDQCEGERVSYQYFYENPIWSVMPNDQGCYHPEVPAQYGSWRVSYLDNGTPCKCLFVAQSKPAC
jgi:hypothetical protein